MPCETNPLAFFGRNIIQDYHTRLRTKLSLDSGQPHSFDVSDDHLRVHLGKNVGILGAGIGGLYAALILDSLDIEYELLEATDHTGGRVSTYKFPGGGKYDYYDMGAMRFPFPKKDSHGRYKNGVMKRLAELTEYGPLNQGQDRLKDSIIPYHFHSQDGSKPAYYYFNGVREPVSNSPKGDFGARDMDIDADYIRAGADAIVSDVAQPFVRMVVQDMETGTKKGWEVLQANDSHTLRSYMAFKYLPSAHLELPPQHLPNNVIDWCGLLGGGSDAALVETVLSMLAYTNTGDSGYGDVQWKCLDGGSETLTKKIEEYLNKKGCLIRFGKRVTAISQSHMTVDIPSSFPGHESPANADEPLDGWVDLAVDQDKTILDGPNEPRTRSTIPSVAVNVMQNNAVRVEYASTTKVAILFKTNWWTTKLGIVGGQTFTDLPICTIVYPSYGVDSNTPSKVLIASYSWKADANHLGSLARTTDREVLLDLVLRNLAEAHSGLHPNLTYAYLREEFIDMHVQDWDREEYAMGKVDSAICDGTLISFSSEGAFAAFAPGQFQSVYTSLTYPAANKRLHFAGEAVSTHHGWVVGALDSSWRAVYEYLKVTGQDEKMKRFKALWGESSEWATKSPLVEAAKETNGHDLLDEHLGLVDRAIRDRVIPLSR
ncbi:hypothetical protein JVT61DRAFT_9855 [Boletus reticuloceps]|uniref:Amine oxidase domain-containing protein n=1 Tax=Boletus reticuloceps TaxID=495285 RepID=A0A8I2YFW6_9AGAM|nr:hypothetical protein JVT61DRAFT_9855 [Boletus reticuloceps]